jgi:hypothetical protein
MTPDLERFNRSGWAAVTEVVMIFVAMIGAFVALGWLLLALAL